MEDVRRRSSAGPIQPNPKDKTSHATVLIVDVTGKKNEVAEHAAKVEANQKANKR